MPYLGSRVFEHILAKRILSHQNFALTSCQSNLTTILGNSQSTRRRVDGQLERGRSDDAGETDGEPLNSTPIQNPCLLVAWRTT